MTMGNSASRTRQRLENPHGEIPRGEGLKLIKATRLIDGLGGPPIERGAILIDGDTIKDVGSEESVVPPEGAQVEEFNYENKTVLPGLIDCHVHMVGIGDGRLGDELTLLPDEVLTLQAARNARAHLYSGVTTLRDCGAKNRTTFMLRQAMEMGITVGPRLILSGRPVAIIGGHLSYFGIQATGPDECRAAVRQLVKEGADFIKITATGGSTRTSFSEFPSFTVPELKAICEEIHKFGKHSVAHCHASQGMLNCLDAGIDTIVHGRHTEPDGSRVYREDVTERLVEQGVFINSNMHGARIKIKRFEDKLATEGLSVEEQKDLDAALREREITLDHYDRMRSAGVRMVAGSDSAWGWHTMGSFYDEVDAQVAAGMTPMEAIISGTSDSAKSCHIDDQTGTLEEGKQADLLVVDGDPSQNIMALKNVADVFLNGILVDRGNLV